MENGELTNNVIEFPREGRTLVRTRESILTPVLSTPQRKVPASSTTFEEVLSFRTGTELRANAVGVRPALTQRELYPVREAFTTEHITALRLLSVAIKRCERAMYATSADDLVGTDTEIQKIQVLLPELFCCRTLGDGFGSVVSAIICSFESLNGNFPNPAQIRALNTVFCVLSDKPFLSVDEADEQIELLEVAELNPYPSELLEFLSSDESVR